MYKLIHSILIIFLLTANAPAIAGSGPVYSELVILGDSLSDTGNHPAALLGAPYPYYRNRISDGPVAVDVLAQALGLDADNSGYIFNNGHGANYAVSGANAVGSEIHDLDAQMAAMLADRGPRLDASALYVLMIGGNDLRDASVLGSLAQGRAAVYRAGNNINTAMQTLIMHGARSIIVSNVPDISRIPETRERAQTNPGLLTRAAQLSRDFNAHLEQQLDTLSSSSGVNLMRFDFYTEFNAIVDNPARYGFSNNRDACFEYSPYSFHPQCDFKKFVFFDSIHPTAKSHQLLGDAMADIVQGQQRHGVIPAVMMLLLSP